MLIDLIYERVLKRPRRPSLPSLDGAMRPNSALEECAALDVLVENPTGLCSDAHGRLFAASGNRIVSVTEGKATIAECDGPINGLAWHAETGLVAGITGHGVLLHAGTGDVRYITKTDGEPILHPTDVAVSTQGAILVVEGSRQYAASEWVRDLMDLGQTGRAVLFDPHSDTGRVIGTGLAFPKTATFDVEGRAIVAEAWAHRVLRLENGALVPVFQNLPGYPGDILFDAEGCWISFFAPRSHIVDFVLEETVFRQRMIKTIDPEYWIAPSVSAEEHHYHPAQVGGLRSQNIKKPWAPARSYGLLIRYDNELQPVRSWHSRADGNRHGTDAMAMFNGRLVLVSRSAGSFLLPESQELAS